MRLLVIEDDDTLRESLCNQLAEAGFGIEQAADGREGLYFSQEYPLRNSSEYRTGGMK